MDGQRAGEAKRDVGEADEILDADVCEAGRRGGDVRQTLDRLLKSILAGAGGSNAFCCWWVFRRLEGGSDSTGHLETVVL